jgi:hypothetical protein
MPAPSLREGLTVPPPTEDHQVVPVDDLVEALVSERLFDVRRLRPPDPPQLVRVVVHEPAGELRPGNLGQGDHLAGAKLSIHLHEPGGKQALAPLS